MIFLLLSISLLSFFSSANDNSILYFEIHHPEGIIRKIINPFSTVLFYRYCVQLQRKICTRFRRNIWAIYVSRPAYTCKEPIWNRVQNHFTSTSLFSHFKVKWFLFYKITSLHFTLKFWENFSLHFTSIFGKVIIFHFTSLHFIFLKCKITSLHFTLLKKKIHFTSL